VNEEHIPWTKSYGVPAACSKKESEEQQFPGLCVNNVFSKGSSIEVRSDLVDCEIQICTEDVLNLFSDNFDKNSIKDGFINWLYESEVLEERIRVFEV